MPFAEPIVDPFTREQRFREGEPPIAEKTDPSIWETAIAAIKLFFPGGAFLDQERHRPGAKPWEEPMEGYNVFSDPRMEPEISMFPSSFEGVFQESHAFRMKDRIQREVGHFQTIRDAGALGYAVSGAVMVLDPFNYMPFGGWGSAPKKVASIRNLIKIGAAADDVARLAASFGTTFGKAERLALANRDLPSITLKDYGGFTKLRLNLDIVRKRAAERAAADVRGGIDAALKDAFGGRIPSRIERYAKAGAEVAIPALASEGVLAATRETYEGEELVYAAGATAVVGGVLGHLRGRTIRKTQEELDTLVARVSDELQAGPLQNRIPESGKLTSEQIAAMGPAKVETHILDQMKQAAPGTFDLVAENKILRTTLRDSPIGRLMTDTGDGSDEIRALAAVLQDHPALRRGAIGPSISSKIDIQLAKMLVDADNVEYLRGQARLSGQDFDRQLILEMVGEQEAGVTVLAETKKAAGAARRGFDDVLRRAVKSGLLQKGLENYFPRFYLWDAIQADQAGFISAIAPHVGGQAKAKAIVKRMSSMKDRAFLDSTNYTLTSERGVFKARELENVPTAKLLPYIDTDVPNVMRRYGRMTNAQIEYAGLTPGDPLDGLNLTSAKTRVGEIFDKRIASAKSQAAKQRLIKEKVARLEDIEFIRQQHLGEFQVDQFDSHLHQVMRGARGLATMVYLPWSGVASLQDVAAVALHNSAGGFWGGSGKWLKRQLLTKIEKGDLNPRDLLTMAKASEYAFSDLSRASLLTDFASTTNAAGIGRRQKRSGNILHRGADKYLTWNGMRPANVMARQVAINAGGNDLLNVIQRRMNGAVRKGDDLILAQAGVGDELAARIAKEMKAGNFSDDVGFLSPDLTKWDPDTADDFSAALFQNAKLNYLNPTAPVLPKWVKTEAGAMFFQFLSTPWHMKNAYLINGYQRLMTGQVGRLAHGTIILSGFAIAYTYLRAAADGEDLDRVEHDEMVERAIGRTGILSIFEIANEALFTFSGGHLGMDEFLGRKLNAGDATDIAALEAISSFRRDAMGVYRNLLTGERMNDSEREKAGNRIPFFNIPYISETIKAMWEMMEE